MFRLSLIFFFFLALQPLGARDKNAVSMPGEKGSLSSFTSLSLKSGSFQSTINCYKSVYLKKKTRRNRSTKSSNVRVPVKPFSLLVVYRSISFFFLSEFILVSRSATPPDRGPPAVI